MTLDRDKLSWPNGGAIVQHFTFPLVSREHYGVEIIFFRSQFLSLGTAILECGIQNNNWVNSKTWPPSAKQMSMFLPLLTNSLPKHVAIFGICPLLQLCERSVLQF